VKVGSKLEQVRLTEKHAPPVGTDGFQKLSENTAACIWRDPGTQTRSPQVQGEIGKSYAMFRVYADPGKGRGKLFQGGFTSENW